MQFSEEGPKTFSKLDHFVISTVHRVFLTANSTVASTLDEKKTHPGKQSIYAKK